MDIFQYFGSLNYK